MRSTDHVLQRIFHNKSTNHVLMLRTKNVLQNDTVTNLNVSCSLVVSFLSLYYLYHVILLIFTVPSFAVTLFYGWLLGLLERHSDGNVSEDHP